MSFRDEWEAMSKDEREAYAKPGAVCVESGCDEPAGTPWGPHWCADHDDERIHRISGQLQDLKRAVR